MKISRRDTIIIASLMNVSLLALLFATSNKIEDKIEIKPAIALEAAPAAQKEAAEATEILAVQRPREPVDEIDQVLQEYALKQKVVTTLPPKAAVAVAESPKEDLVDVTVKKGDKLTKIAKLHGVKVEEIMKENLLETPQLKIGQHLKIPKKTAETQEPEYYVIKSGDNPWKIAKKQGLKYEELLRLNNMSEEKAKNLKIGQKIRIR